MAATNASPMGTRFDSVLAGCLNQPGRTASQKHESEQSIGIPGHPFAAVIANKARVGASVATSQKSGAERARTPRVSQHVFERVRARRTPTRTKWLLPAMAIEVSAASRRKTQLLRVLKVAPLVVIAAVVLRFKVLAPVPARSFVVAEGDVVHEVYGRATIESRREVELGFDLVGRLTDVLVDEGDSVKLGQVVARLAPEQLVADVRVASSGVPLAKAALARLDAEERKAQASLVFAEQEAKRMRTLAASNSVSPRDLDLAEQQLALAKADLDRVLATQGEAQKEIAVASSATESKSATATRAVLVSPFDGVVVRRFKDPGDTVVVGTTVLRVVAVDRLWARAAIDESMLPGLREGLPAQVTLLGASGEPLRGTVDRVGREVDRQTHEVLVDVLLAKPPSPIAMGQRADVWIELERRPRVPRVPVAFLRRDARGDYALVDRDGRVSRADVKVGLIGRELLEIASGLRAGDTVLDSPVPGAVLAEGRRWRASP